MICLRLHGEGKGKQSEKGQRVPVRPAMYIHQLSFTASLGGPSCFLNRAGISHIRLDFTMSGGPGGMEFMYRVDRPKSMTGLTSALSAKGCHPGPRGHPQGHLPEALWF